MTPLKDLETWLGFLETWGQGETMGERVTSLGGFSEALRQYREQL